MILKTKKNSCVNMNGHHLEPWPFARGHTNMNRFWSCFMFVWPHVNSLLAFFVCSLMFVIPIKLLYTTLVVLIPSFSSCHSVSQLRLALPSITSRSLQGGLRDKSMYVGNKLCDTVWTRVLYHLLETSNGEGGRTSWRMRPKGLEDCTFYVLLRS
ncbi:hypothetical protein BDM02DRAFT_1377863 [Thelephora ganbajun]|uniref:Uncharacterized protein n=1 Tax=Thelephora ganbajun TaxID=370292 RepID=A0ACB6ZMV8_THEGA|nr:hypothetical protein BDM02DRAFT_1377863 [Thelephora ganbajun]